MDNEQKFLDWKNSILRVTRYFLMKFFWKKKCDFFFFIVYWTDFLVFCQRISHRNIKNESYVSTGNLGRKKFFFEKTLTVLIVFGNERKIFGLLAKLFGRVVHKLLSTCPWVHFEKFFEKKVRYILSFSQTEQSLFRHSVEDFPAGLSEKTIKTFNHFRTLSEKFSIFCGKNCSSAAKTACYVFTGTVWMKFFFEKKSSVSFILIGQGASEKKLAFYQLFYNGVSKSVFHVSMGTFRRKIFSINLNRFSIFFQTMTGKKIRLSVKLFFGRVEKLHFTSLWI